MLRRLVYYLDSVSDSAFALHFYEAFFLEIIMEYLLFAWFCILYVYFI